jgi:antitoxin component of RelBE/YafQ-DinJ toxin-antitoxin module
MKITLSIEEKVAEEARKVAQSMGKSLNQLVRDYLEQLARLDQLTEEIAEFRRLSLDSRGDSRGWRFNRDELHERT